MRMPFSAQKRQTLRRPAPRRPRGPRSSRPRPRPRAAPPPPLRPPVRPGMLVYLLLDVADFGVGTESFVIVVFNVCCYIGPAVLDRQRGRGRSVLVLAHGDKAQYR